MSTVINPKLAKDYLEALQAQCKNINETQKIIADEYWRIANTWRDRVRLETGKALNNCEGKFSDIYEKMVKVINFVIDNYNNYVRNYNGHNVTIDHFKNRFERKLERAPHETVQFKDEHITDPNVLRSFIDKLKNYVIASAKIMMTIINETANTQRYWKSEKHAQFVKIINANIEELKVPFQKINKELIPELENKYRIFMRG